ncbi:MAG TPA: PPC domain-containing protein, partial [Saprospiraceae bacterium]|nr:PPC domain-containing protein [Saprospiraceae bacterium]
QACAGNIYSNEGASISGNEPVPDADPSDGTAGRWQNGIERTVWFRFVAPASGTVKISTENVPQGSNFDTQVALYKATDPADYTTFTLLESDEDSGEIGLGFNAELTYTGLQPGTAYYIQVDDYGTSAGTFCIAVIETGPRTLDSNCGAGYSVGGVDGTQPDGDHWYNIYTVPGAFEVGDLVAAIKPGPQNLGTVWCQINNIDSIPADNYGQEYMPAYFNFRSQIAPVGPVSLRLFFYDSEFQALKAKANLPAATIEDLNATHYRGPLQDCLLPGNSYADHSKFELITAVDGVSVGTSGTFYVELEVDSMGEVGVHLLAAPLPLELRAFEGKIADAHNLLEWETLLERQVQWHVVERSADNAYWVEIGRRPGALLSGQPIRYALEDRSPLPRGYYRLRSIDV